MAVSPTLGAYTVSGSSLAGKTVSASSQSARTALPLDAAGKPARFVRLATTGGVYVRPGSSTVTSSSTGLYIGSGDSQVLGVLGCGYLGYIRESSTSKLNIMTVEF